MFLLCRPNCEPTAHAELYFAKPRKTQMEYERHAGGRHNFIAIRPGQTVSHDVYLHHRYHVISGPAFVHARWDVVQERDEELCIIGRPSALIPITIETPSAANTARSVDNLRANLRKANNSESELEFTTNCLQFLEHREFLSLALEMLETPDNPIPGSLIDSLILLGNNDAHLKSLILQHLTSKSTLGVMGFFSSRSVGEPFFEKSHLDLLSKHREPMVRSLYYHLFPDRCSREWITQLMADMCRPRCPAEKDVEQIVALLDSPSFAIREANTKKLLECDESLIPALTECLERRASAEVELRLRSVIQAIQSRGIDLLDERVIFYLGNDYNAQAELILSDLAQNAPIAIVRKRAGAELDKNKTRKEDKRSGGK